MRRNATDSEKYIWKRRICRLLAKTYKDPHPEGMETKTPQCSFLPSTGLKSPAQPEKSGTSLISFKTGSDIILSNVSSIEFLKDPPLLKWRILYSFRLKMI